MKYFIEDGLGNIRFSLSRQTENSGIEGYTTNKKIFLKSFDYFSDEIDSGDGYYVFNKTDASITSDLVIIYLSNIDAVLLITKHYFDSSIAPLINFHIEELEEGNNKELDSIIWKKALKNIPCNHKK